MILLRKPTKQLNNSLKTAMKMSLKCMMTEQLFSTGRGFRSLPLSYIVKAPGLHGDAKKWCGAHSTQKLPSILVFGKDWSKDSFTLVSLKEKMRITLFLWVLGPFQRSCLKPFIRPCTFLTKCFKLLRTLQTDQETKKQKQLRYKESSLALLILKSQLPAMPSKLATKFSSR